MNELTINGHYTKHYIINNLRKNRLIRWECLYSIIFDYTQVPDAMWG